MERKGPPNNFQQKQSTLAMINMIMKIMLDESIIELNIIIELNRLGFMCVKFLCLLVKN